MDATIKKKLDFYNKQNQMLANTAADATNHYNYIINTNFDNNFWIGAGLAGGASALLAKAMVPTVTISPLPEMIATAASTELATVGGSTALATTTTAAAATSTELALSGIITTAEGVEVLTGAANTAALANAVEVGAGTAATGATAAGGGAAITAALPYVAAGIAAYLIGKSVGELAGQYIYYKTGKKELEELSGNVNSLKYYCNIMRSQISKALKDLSAASEYISDAEKKIVNQQYITKDSNLKKIRERQAEVKSMYSSLEATKSIVDIVYNNLKLIA